MCVNFRICELKCRHFSVIGINSDLIALNKLKYKTFIFQKEF